MLLGGCSCCNNVLQMRCRFVVMLPPLAHDELQICKCIVVHCSAYVIQSCLRVIHHPQLHVACHNKTYLTCLSSSMPPRTCLFPWLTGCWLLTWPICVCHCFSAQVLLNGWLAPFLKASCRGCASHNSHSILPALKLEYQSMVHEFWPCTPSQK